MAPAFQFLLTAGGGYYPSLSEDGLIIWDHRAKAAVETPLASPKGDISRIALLQNHTSETGATQMAILM